MKEVFIWEERGNSGSGFIIELMNRESGIIYRNNEEEKFWYGRRKWVSL